MNLLAAFFRLIRWPNLFFIALTQSLFYFCVFHSLLPENFKPFDHNLFYWLVLASILIAAAGYIINDYFDMQIDAVNKPGRVVIDKVIKRRWAILWHWVISSLGFIISIYISYQSGIWVIALANLLVILVLVIYSSTLKKKLLSGNIVVAGLTAWVIIVVYFFCLSIGFEGDLALPGWDTKKFFKYMILYAGFAFIVSLIREVIKDLEDKQGDARYGCRTMPIAWGVPATKVFAAVWLVVCIASLIIVLLYAWQLGWWYIVIYSLLVVILPLIYILRNLYKANASQEYHRLSTAIKFVMLAGILSMLFFIL